jgi:DNA primase
VATFKAADELLRVGVHPSVATLPRGEDPDSIARKGGSEALAKYTDAAVDVLDRKVQILQQRGYLDSIEGKRRAVDSLLLTVRATADEALRDIYIDRVSAVTGVRRSTLLRELKRPVAEARRRPTPPQTTELAPDEVPRLGAERKLLLLLLRDRSLVARVAQQVEPDNFRTPEYREIYRALVGADSRAAEPDETERQDPLEWAADLPTPLYERIAELVADPEELTNPETVLEDAIGRLREHALQKRLADLMTEMMVSDTDTQVELASEVKKVRQELTALGSRLPGRGFYRDE